MSEENLGATVDPAVAAEPAALSPEPDPNPEAAKPATIVEDPGEGKPVAAPATWPDDWREKLAGEDRKALKTLERMADPSAVWKRAQELQAKLSSGEYMRVPPKDATEEDLAAYRKEIGLPEKPEDYEIALPQGAVMGEADKPIFDSFKGIAHKANMTPDQLNAAADWYFQMQRDQADAQDQFDDDFRKTAEDELRGEWGNDYRRNVNSITGLFAGAPDGVKDRLLASRIPVYDKDGNVTGMAPLGNDPNVVKWLVSLASEINPAATLVPGSPSSSAQSIDEEIKAIEKRMVDDREGYFKDDKAQERYRELLAAQEKLNSRAA